MHIEICKISHILYKQLNFRTDEIYKKVVTPFLSPFDVTRVKANDVEKYSLSYAM